MKFRLFGFDVAIHPSFFLMAVFLGLPRGGDPEALARSLTWVVAVTASVLIHELGHAFATRAFGGTAHIELYSLGGLTYPKAPSERGFSYGQDAGISFAGPAAGFLFGGLVYLAARAGAVEDDGMGATFLGQLLWVNVGWGALNLLPMLPLDGGHIMRTLLNALTAGKGERPAALVSIGVSAVAALAAFKLGWTWAALIAAFSGFSTFRELREVGARAHDEEYVKAFRRLREEQRVDDAHTIAELERLLELARSTSLQNQIATELAWRHVAAGDADAAAAATAHMPDGRAPDGLMGAILAGQGRTEEAIVHLERALAGAEDEESPWLWGVKVLGEAYVEEGQPDRVVALVTRFADRLGSRNLAAHLSEKLFHADAFEASAELAGLAFERFGAGEDAYNAACALARAEQPAQALEWLRKAVAAGYDDAAHLDADDDLATLRNLPGYAALRATVGQGGRP